MRIIEAQAKRLSHQTSLVILATVVSILLPVYHLTAAPGLTWLNHGADGGELVAAVATWGVPHPTGYPTFVLLGRLFLALPWSDPAYRLTLMSVVSMALAGGILGALAAQGAQGGRWLKSACGIVVGLSFGLGALSWAQATIVEVHGLNALFMALALLLIGRIGARPGPPGMAGVSLAFMSGLALGNHLTFVLLLPAVGAALWRKRREAWPWHPASWIAAFVVGLSVYLYLPLASHTQPTIDWGNPSTWKGFSWVISGGPYRGLVFGYPLAGIPGQIAA
ncbi:MAG: protein O-mannosyl-transferase family, partial [Anaerolineales bacterium]